ncbi:MAG: DUF4384 domain-containing protein [Candidatus Obscuribacterales bacterium]|nr:DUF4384 domain-containing protein [Candidatus Obscuribacterales bacterium]
MNGFSFYVTCGAAACFLALLSPESMANETEANKIGGQERGASFTNIIPPQAVPGIQAAAIKVPPKAKIQLKVAKNKSKVILTKAQPASAPTQHSPVPPPVIPASHSVVTAHGMPAVIATLDRKGGMPVYKVGEKMTINVSANTDCNIVVFNYDSTGTLIQIFPNDYQQSGFLKAGENVHIGGNESPFDYQISGKGGKEKIFVYAYPQGTEAPLEVALSQVPGTPFRAAEMTPEKYRELVNNAKSFFSREVKVVPKKNYQSTSAMTNIAPSANKVELTFQVEK